MFLRTLFNTVAGALHSLVQVADDTVGAVSSTLTPPIPRTTKKTSPRIRVEMREIVIQVIDKLQQTYETRSSVQNTVCIICIFKQASWLKLLDAIGLIDQSIIQTRRNLEMYDTTESRREIALLTAIQQSFGVIVPKLSRLIELGTTLSQKIEQDNLSDEQAKETEEFIEIAGTSDIYGVYKGGLIDNVKDYITKWLKDHGKKTYVQSHFQPLFDFWEEHENDLLRFKSWPTISLVDPDPKPFVIKHQRKVLSPDELLSSEEIYSIISDQAGSDLIEKLHFLSVYIIGPKRGTLDLIDTVFPDRPAQPHWYESMLSLGQVYSSSTSRGSNSSRLSSPKSCSTRFPKSPSVTSLSLSNQGRSRNALGGSMISSPRSQHNSARPEKNTYFFVKGKRIDTANQKKMVDLVQSAVRMFNLEQVPELPLLRSTLSSITASRFPTSTTTPRRPTTPSSTPASRHPTSTTSLRHPMPSSAASSSSTPPLSGTHSSSTSSALTRSQSPTHSSSTSSALTPSQSPTHSSSTSSALTPSQSPLPPQNPRMTRRRPIKPSTTIERPSSPSIPTQS